MLHNAEGQDEARFTVLLQSVWRIFDAENYKYWSQGHKMWADTYKPIYMRTCRVQTTVSHHKRIPT